ncbi:MULTISPECIES: carboxymuconolactone decarboxylase family protein [unclassified Pseudofrankia]|uniref:carboxymuconolactone decarboxylase family protein n=1 Tax=unclassified Pseudofrankia TaxID=2994372 RepID=UPI0008DA9BAE|nr:MULTISPECIES: carboxymuconolactone decarboxylase family protein [unclassified Pseudofrankia]MDT3444680.1 carboxymuconolactone decarboxylase family protein [Pseudofrankia sp. BMG5.37]OHV66579.1 4-carboxymuconolactone decarboxylase [Pseudofrankia sp. BMG5.36]
MDESTYSAGEAVRREVAGNAVVDAARNADDFNKPMQDILTEFCWGTVWTRPELDRRSRSILNIGMLAALNRPDQLAGHVRSGITNGLSKAEIRECLLQVAVYAGMPAGLSSFAIASKVFEELDI